MKYMGSKRAMLQNGLGELLSSQIATGKRFVDLFCGSGAVGVHVAKHYSLPVVAFDLQRFSAVLSGAVIQRTRKLAWRTIWERWRRRAQYRVRRRRAPRAEQVTKNSVEQYRRWCARQSDLPITRAYGGYYFSPEQAVWIDALRMSLPKTKPARTVALAALIQAASQCAAAPGHTAQPFQPTRRGRIYLADLWRRDIAERTERAFCQLAQQCARRRGSAEVADANEVAARLRPGDVVFIDPPYSSVQYSRFYHVLETIAHGSCASVEGTGRYPPSRQRPRSRYSLKSEAETALDELLKAVAKRHVRAILTFPNHTCSNGLSGDKVRRIAARYFDTRKLTVESRFSTLGGIGVNGKREAARAARQPATELMLVLGRRSGTTRRTATI